MQANLQKSENVRLQQQLTTLKGEKTSIHQQIIALQRRVEELEEEMKPNQKVEFVQMIIGELSEVALLLQYLGSKKYKPLYERAESHRTGTSPDYLKGCRTPPLNQLSSAISAAYVRLCIMRSSNSETLLTTNL